MNISVGFIFIIFIVFGCTSPDADNSVDFKTIVVEESEAIITPESHTELAFPAFIRTAPDYFLILEGRLNKIFKFSYEGKQLSSFGRKGRGPGEIQSLINYWIMEDHYLLYDFNGAKMIQYDFDGSFINEYPVKFGGRPSSVEVLSTDIFIHPANGEEGSLLKVSDLKNEETRYIGEAIAVEVEEPDEDLRSMIRSGRLPNYMLNSISLGANESGIFVFQQVNAVLQKYHFNGELVWERNLKIPPVDGVYEEFLRKVNEQERVLPQLYYGHGLHAIEEGVYLMLNTPDDKPITMIWIPNDGNDIQVIEFPDIERDPNFPLRFRVAPDSGFIFFVKSLDGEVLSSAWPID